MEQVQNSLYQESFEHDACGIGGVIHIKGNKSHQVVDDALKIVEKLEHRAGKDATGAKPGALRDSNNPGGKADAAAQPAADFLKVPAA